MAKEEELEEGVQLSGVSDEDANSAEDEHEEMLHSSKIHRIQQQTQWVITSFTVMLFVHACICEGPAAILECVVRASVCIGFGILCCGVGVLMCSARIVRHGLRSLKESLIVIAAMLSLVVPGCCLVPYRGFRPEDDWDVEPIPTIMGWVDVRRFFVYAFGQAELADNIHEANVAQDTCEDQMWCFPRQWAVIRHTLLPESPEEADDIELADLKPNIEA